MARTKPHRAPPRRPRRPRSARVARGARGARIQRPPDPRLAPRAQADAALRTALCAAGKRLHQRDLIGAAEGNLSARLGDGTWLVTPSGVSKGALTPRDLLVVDGEGRVVSGRGRPSTELRMHLAAYEARPDIAAAVHAHPITAVAFTVAGLPWPGHLVPEAAVTLGPVAVAPFAVPGTEAVAAALAPLMPGHDVFLLERHGVLCLGRTVLEAIDRMETLERVARMALTARLLGALTPLTPDQVDAVLAAAGQLVRRP